MKKSFRIFTALLICIALILPINVSASENSLDFSSAASKVEYSTLGMISTDQLKNAKLSEKDVPEALLVRNADTSSFVHRVRSLEDEYSLVYQNSDGTNTMLQFTTPIQYRDADGNLRDKSTKTQLIDGQHVTTENDVKVSIPQNLEQGVSLEFDGYALAMKPTGMVSSISSVAKMDSELKTAADTSIYKYSGLYDADTDIVYSPAFSGVKCDIVLKKYTGRSEFEFAVLLKGLHLEKDDNEKIIYMLNSDNEKVAYFNTVMSYDSNGKVSFGDMDFEQLGEGQYIVTLKVDEGFLTDDETVYPLTIDFDETVYPPHTQPMAFEYLCVYSNGSSVHSLSQPTEDMLLGRSWSGTGRILYKFSESEISSHVLMKSLLRVEIHQCVSNQAMYEVFSYPFIGNAWSDTSSYNSVSIDSYDSLFSIPVTYGEGYGPYSVHMVIDVTNFYNACYTQEYPYYSRDKGVILINKNGENASTISYLAIATNSAGNFSPYVLLRYEPYKIMLDPGHCEGHNIHDYVYNGESYTYSEGTQMRRLYELLSARLLQYGFAVDVAVEDPTENPDYTTRGNRAVKEKCDMLLALHSNGVLNGDPQYAHREVVYMINLNASSEIASLGNSLANVTKNLLNIKQPNTKKYGHTEINAAVEGGCPIAILIEHSFHDNPQSSYMLMQPSILSAIADGEASVINDFFWNK